MKSKLMYFIPILALSYSAFAQQLNYDVRDKWVGEYDGTCDLVRDGKPMKGMRARLTVRKGDIVFVAHSEDITTKYFTITVPESTEKFPDLTLAADSIEIRPVSGRPQKMTCKKSAGPFGDEILVGDIVFYKLTTDGKASVTLEVPRFAVGKTDKP